MASSFFCVAVLFVSTLRSPLFSLGSPISDTDDPEVCRTQKCQESAKFLFDAMDVSADPCEDFYRYSCGGWIDKRAAPEDARVITVRSELQDEVYSMVAESLRNAHNEIHPKAVLDAATLFQGCIDEGARERRGLDPLRNVLNSLGGWPMIDPQWTNTSYQWHKQIATLKRTFGIEAILSVSVDDDNLENTPRHLLLVHRPWDYGLDETYLENETSELNREVIAAYRNYIISVGKILNPSMDETSLANDADEIIEFKKALVAKDYMETKFLKYGSFTLSELQRINQTEYFEIADFLNDVLQDLPQVEDGARIWFYNPIYLERAIQAVQDTDKRIVANYIGWILLQNFGHHTTKDFRDITAHFKMTLEGMEPDNLEKACVKEIEDTLGFAVGRLYADKYVSKDEMREVEQLAEDIRTAFEVNLNHNDWMDTRTKQKALEKLQANLTLHEDIADNGGVRYPYMAYKIQVLEAEENQDIKTNMRLPGLSATPEQLYFIGFGTMECARYTERSMKWTLENDPHSPAEYRRLIPLRNSRAFSEAFNCPIGSPMNPEKKCQLW